MISQFVFWPLRTFSTVSDEQSIENDLSTFSSHVTNLRYMLNQANEKALVLIDEKRLKENQEDYLMSLA